ncbi:MAG TPA: carbohydrate ABC transporter permease [Propionibacteriaceae bacterium]|jgi:raffinose/stachyose/melibiose transport system permease protein|nr:carbohydrate ABC transporter permease [Propionibacteriaceae bacterium]
MTSMLETAPPSKKFPEKNDSAASVLVRRRNHRLLSALAYVVTLIIVSPILWIVVLSFQPSANILNDPFSFKQLSLDNYHNAIESLPLVRMYLNTFVIAVVAVVLGTTVSFMAAFALTRMVFRRRRFQLSLKLFLLAGLAVPVYILLFPVYRLDLSLGLFGTYGALILPYAAVSIPFNTLLMTGFLADFPSEIEEAAIIDGAGLWRLCVSVVLPLMRPVIATIIIFNIVYVFNEFPFASILINDPDMVTVSLAVSRFQGQFTVDYGGMMASATMVLIPQLVIYALFQRQIIAGMTAGAVKG